MSEPWGFPLAACGSRLRGPERARPAPLKGSRGASRGNSPALLPAEAEQGDCGPCSPGRGRGPGQDQGRQQGERVPGRAHPAVRSGSEPRLPAGAAQGGGRGGGGCAGLNGERRLWRQRRGAGAVSASRGLSHLPRAGGPFVGLRGHGQEEPSRVLSCSGRGRCPPALPSPPASRPGRARGGRTGERRPGVSPQPLPLPGGRPGVLAAPRASWLPPGSRER